MLKKLLSVLFVIVCGFVKIVFFGGLLCALVYGIYRLERASCMRQFAEFNPEFTVVGGCMITVDEQRVPASSFRMTM